MKPGVKAEELVPLDGIDKGCDDDENDDEDGNATLVERDVTRSSQLSGIVGE